MSDKDTRGATARREKTYPTLEQVKHVLSKMPAGSDRERRNRALVAFTLLTGARDSDIASVRLKHVDLINSSVFQDAREVNTKFSKTFTTFFFPVGDEIRQIVADWVAYLREAKHWGNDDPLFPSTQMIIGSARHFEVDGLKREHWSSAAPIRKIFHEAFEAAGLPYFKPHSLRNTLVRLGEMRCQTPEQFKAWSQNLGHEGVLTTFYSYGEVGNRRQGEIIQNLAASRPSEHPDVTEFAKALMREMRSSRQIE